MRRVLVTGGTGCIGAATTRSLLDRGVDTVLVVSRHGETQNLEIWLGPKLDDRVQLITADLADPESTRRLLADHRPSHIIHLAALQSPECDANPIRGMGVNTGSTVSLLEGARELDGLERVVFASSGAVYGRRSQYTGPVIAEGDRLLPPNYYGVWKVAGEHLMRLYHEQTGVPTVCLRLNTTYGPGRDQGRTAAATAALKAVALGEAFAMPYRGRENYHYVTDVGAHFATGAMDPFSGFTALNIRGRTVLVREFLEEATKVASQMGLDAELSVAKDAPESIFSCDLADQAMQLAFPGVPCVELSEGIEKSLAVFRIMVSDGRLSTRPRRS